MKTEVKTKTEARRDSLTQILEQHSLHHKNRSADTANIHPKIQSSGGWRVIPCFHVNLLPVLRVFKVLEHLTPHCPINREHTFINNNPEIIILISYCTEFHIEF